MLHTRPCQARANASHRPPHGTEKVRVELWGRKLLNFLSKTVRGCGPNKKNRFRGNCNFNSLLSPPVDQIPCKTPKTNSRLRSTYGVDKPYIPSYAVMLMSNQNKSIPSIFFPIHCLTLHRRIQIAVPHPAETPLCLFRPS